MLERQIVQLLLPEDEELHELCTVRDHEKLLTALRQRIRSLHRRIQGRLRRAKAEYGPDERVNDGHWRQYWADIEEPARQHLRASLASSWCQPTGATRKRRSSPARRWVG